MVRIAFFICLFPFTVLSQSKMDQSSIHPIDAQKASMKKSVFGLSRSSSIDTRLKEIVNRYSSPRISFQLIDKKVSLVGSHYRYQQLIDGIKVYRGDLKINLDKNGNVLSVFENTYSPQDILVNNISSHQNRADKVYYYDGENLKAGKLTTVESSPGIWVERIFSFDGQQQYENNLTMFHHAHLDADSTAKAYVHMPNPIVSGNTIYGGNYKDNNDQASPTLNGERKKVDIKVDFSNNIFSLKNSYVKISEHSLPVNVPSTSNTPEFLFDRSQDGFEEVNVVYHITTFQEYIQSLGFSNLVNYPIRVDPHGFSGQDNSAFTFSPSPRLTFGEGGVDDAEDAQVILHEYTHAIMHDAAPNTNNGVERNALDEANGDYISASYSKSITPHSWEKVFSWDGHNEFWGGRSAKTNKKYPGDLKNHLYQDAPIWSATLMQIEANITRATATKVLLQSAYNYANNMTMSQAATLYIQADSSLNNGANYPYICHLFKDRGLVSTCNAPRPIFVNVDGKLMSSSPKAIVQNSLGFVSGTNPLKILLPKKDVEFRMYNLEGKLVKEGNISDSELELNPLSIDKGYYILQLRSINYTEVIKFTR